MCNLNTGCAYELLRQSASGLTSFAVPRTGLRLGPAPRSASAMAALASDDRDRELLCVDCNIPSNELWGQIAQTSRLTKRYVMEPLVPLC